MAFTLKMSRLPSYANMTHISWRYQRRPKMNVLRQDFQKFVLQTYMHVGLQISENIDGNKNTEEPKPTVPGWLTGTARMTACTWLCTTPVDETAQKSFDELHSHIYPLDKKRHSPEVVCRRSVSWKLACVTGDGLSVVIKTFLVGCSPIGTPNPLPPADST